MKQKHKAESWLGWAALRLGWMKPGWTESAGLGRAGLGFIEVLDLINLGLVGIAVSWLVLPQFGIRLSWIPWAWGELAWL